MELAELVDPHEAPGTRLTIIRGIAGVGKTRLLSAADRRRGRGVRLVGRCGEASAPLRPLREVAVSAMKLAVEPDQVSESMFRWGYRALLGGVGDFPPLSPDEGSPQALLVGEALMELLDLLPPPVVVDIEDVHWADAESLEILDHLVDSDPRGIDLRLTIRSDEPSAAAEAVSRWAIHRGSRTIDLAPLSPEDAASMIGACLNTDGLDGLVQMVAKRSDGVPLMIEELLIGAAESAHLTRRGSTWVLESSVSSVLADPPPTLTELVRRRMAAVSPESQDVLRLGALIGRQVEPSLLARFGLTLGQVESAETEGLRHHLLAAGERDHGLRFSHALTREAVNAITSAETKRALARKALEHAASSVERDRPEVVAQLAGAAGESDRAVRLLLSAAERALAMGAVAAALGHLESANHRATRLQDQIQIDVSRVEALAHTGRADDALEVASRLDVRVAASPSAPARQRLRLAQARALGVLGRWEQAADTIAATDDGTASVAVMRAVCAIELGDFATAGSLAATATERAERDGDHGSQCQAMLIEGRIVRGTDLAESARLLAAAVGLAEQHDLPLWRARGLFELGLSEVLIDGREHALHRGRDAALDIGALRLSAMADYCLSFNAGWRFEPDRCQFIASRGMETCRRIGIPFLEARLQAQLGKAAALAQRRGEAAAAGDRAIELAPDDPEVAGLAWGLCRGYASLLAEDRLAAVAEYRTAIDHLRRLPFKTGIQPWRLWPLLMMLDDPDGDGVTARAEVDVTELRVQNSLGMMFRLADAAAAGREGDTSRADRLVREVASFYGPLPEPHHGTMHLGMRLTAEAALRDRWGEPVKWLNAAEAWFTPRGFTKIAQACRALLKQAGEAPRRRGPGRNDLPSVLTERGITAREAEVLGLVAEGLTNQDIADRLVVSPWTVKSQVSSLLRKVGVSNRSQLATFAHESAD